MKRHFVSDAQCGLCGAEVEDVDHILRRFPNSLLVWRQLVRADKMLEFMSCDIKSWIKLNLTQPHRFAIDIADWDLMFGGVCWFIWLRRNDLVFNAGHEEEVRQPVLDRARRWLALAVAAQGAADALQHLPSQGGRELVSWSPPPHGWVKLNTDAARVDQNGYMSCGGLARDEHGSWMVGFGKFIG
ncbi:hypothetical protein V6N11_055888 [Hibiscus sabdariffa]|uniref:RNase H type-1 domain-containing protein n=1 Tax=Hibiscus sabdariffa TaxID=183260 RepID=A0ABR2T2I3_9ROSI